MRLKSLIYRYFGIYLAAKDKAAYSDTPEFKRSVKALIAHGWNKKDAEDTMLGEWDVDNGFIRSWSRFNIRYYKYNKKRIRYLFDVLVWLDTFYQELAWDVKVLYYKLKVKIKDFLIKRG